MGGRRQQRGRSGDESGAPAAQGRPPAAAAHAERAPPAAAEAGGSELPTLAEVEATLVPLLGLRSAGSLLGVYIQGSRLWGTAGPHSDVDLLVVVAGDAPKRATHSGRFDISWIGEECFRQRQREGRLQELLCQWAPPQLVLKALPPELRGHKAEPLAIAAEVADETEKDLGRVAKLEARGMREHARKIICHCVRAHLLALQIIRTGSVSNFAASRAVHSALGLAHATAYCDAHAAPAPDGGGIAGLWERLVDEAGEGPAAGESAARAYLEHLRAALRDEAQRAPRR
eukprot:TRINITY_DN7397_c0_g1_i1.p1 TRINITY_DN7397_c0_g1~~TRINITY_DN7397_c0_g1_i1.p1  ORF type:complete len:308 (+),score=70.53 TRINITY_DN7397_c0_g1_i1:64-924(+)